MLEQLQDKANVTDQDEAPIGYYAALADPRYTKATLFCCLIGVINQVCGITAINMYSTTIFQDIGLSTEIGSVIVGTS